MALKPVYSIFKILEAGLRTSRGQSEAHPWTLDLTLDLALDLYLDPSISDPSIFM